MDDQFEQAHPLRLDRSLTARTGSRVTMPEKTTVVDVADLYFATLGEWLDWTVPYRGGTQ